MVSVLLNSNTDLVCVEYNYVYMNYTCCRNNASNKLRIAPYVYCKVAAMKVVFRKSSDVHSDL